MTGDTMNLRMLRAAKNRFGSSDEVGVYEMTAGRLLPVSDPSSLLLKHRLNADDSEGCAITVAVEGVRAVTVEIQALVTPCAGGPTASSKRTVNGISYSRLSILLGVLQKRCGIMFGKKDVYVNIVGYSMQLGQKRGDESSSSDLAVAVALVSSLTSVPVRSDTAFIGEIDLLGELRQVTVVEKRIQEAKRMGFSRIITPFSYKKRKALGTDAGKNGQVIVSRDYGIERIQCETLVAAINAGLVRHLPKRKKSSPYRDETLSSNSAPGSLEDLSLEDPIMDDQEEDEDFYYL